MITWVFAVTAATGDEWVTHNGVQDGKLGIGCGGHGDSICRPCECLTWGNPDVDVDREHQEVEVPASSGRLHSRKQSSPIAVDDEKRELPLRCVDVYVG